MADDTNKLLAEILVELKKLNASIPRDPKILFDNIQLTTLENLGKDILELAKAIKENKQS
ncbi:MAG: hypothetical protein NTZ74_08215 [Chloroflexi bacterium]|nr:hypothetical protein [Chloroflexota bacterium]